MSTITIIILSVIALYVWYMIGQKACIYYLKRKYHKNLKRAILAVNIISFLGAFLWIPVLIATYKKQIIR